MQANDSSSLGDGALFILGGIDMYKKVSTDLKFVEREKGGKVLGGQ